jgi:hypothetical protein
VLCYDRLVAVFLKLDSGFVPTPDNRIEATLSQAGAALGAASSGFPFDVHHPRPVPGLD